MNLLQKARILTIDDERLVCQSIKVRLRMAGFFKVESHTDPTTAMDKVSTYMPDVILLDIMMPEVSGLELLPKLVGLESAPAVIMLSAADMETKYQSLELGAADFINKPIDSKELVVRVKNVLRQHLGDVENVNSQPELT